MNNTDATDEFDDAWNVIVAVANNDEITLQRVLKAYRAHSARELIVVIARLTVAIIEDDGARRDAADALGAA